MIVEQHQYRIVCDVATCGKSSGFNKDVPSIIAEVLAKGWEVQGTDGPVRHRCPKCVERGLYPPGWMKVESVNS